MTTEPRQDGDDSFQKVTKDNVPKYPDLMNPLLQALRDLGGSGSIDEIHDSVVEILDLPDSVVDVLHNPEQTNRSELEYQLAWTRTYLKKYGLLENSSRGVWVLSSNGRGVEEVDPRAVGRYVRELGRKKREKQEESEDTEGEDDVPEETRPWRSQLHRVLTQKMKPAAFERLTKRLLRESGFVQVEVTGRSGDGGVDGRGIMQVGGFLSFHVVFQCKRYQGSVSAGHVRDFRGAMVGRADKGLLITTGTFTRDAVREATRDGAPPIDLVDGDDLADKLKELELGVSTEVVEKVDVEEDWFRSI